MDFLLNCGCFHKCPLSSQRGTYNTYDQEQKQRQRRDSWRQQRACGPEEREATVPTLMPSPQEQQATSAAAQATTISTTADREPAGGLKNGEILVSRRSQRVQKFQEKYACIHEESQDDPASKPRCLLVSGVDKIVDRPLASTVMGNKATSADSVSAMSPPETSKNNPMSGLPASGPVLASFSLESVADLIKQDKINKSSVIVLVGAGMSTAAGVPDFRSPGAGIYANLAKYNLPHPEDVFKISYFKNNPAPFYELSRTLLPDKLYPTMSHYFVRLLYDKGYLMRCYSQNVDCLESLSGLPKDKLCLAHGSFETGHCLRCNAEYSLAWMRAIVEQGGIPHCVSTKDCKGLVKPDVKFFGERLDGRFFRLAKEDFPKCELLIIIGSSLSVMPFAQLVQKVPARCPRLLINKTKSGHSIPALFRIFKPSNGLMYDRKSNIRDVAHLGDCDVSCTKLATLLGWDDELSALTERRRKELDEQNADEKRQQLTQRQQQQH